MIKYELLLQVQLAQVSALKGLSEEA